MDINVQYTILAFVALGAVALSLQTVFLVILATTLQKAVRSLRGELEEYRSAVMPVISSVEPIVAKTNDLVERLAPKIEDVAGELTEITKSLRAQTADIQRAADDVIARTQRQAARVDGMLTTVFDGMERAGTFVAETVQKPMRQLSGVVSTARAMVEALRAPDAPRRPRAVIRAPEPGVPLPNTNPPR